MTRQPVVGVGAVVLRGDHVLLIERGQPPGVGTWSIPGGKVMAGERLVDAVARELFEETSLVATVGPLIEVVEIMRDAYHYVVLDYLCDLNPPDQVAVAASDAADVRWVHVDQLADVQTTDLVRKVVGRAVAMRNETR